LKRSDVPDIVAMRVVVSGTRKGERVRYTYHVLDRYDKNRRVTAMARSTAYSASIAAQLLAKKAIKEKGVFPPEKIGMNEKLYKKFMDEVKKRKIVVKEAKKILH